MSPAPTIWEEGRTRGRRVVALGAALVLTAAAIDLLIADRLGLVFDIGFVITVVVLALLVHPQDMFTAGVLPPLLMLGLFVLLASTRVESIAQADDHVIQAIVTGLGHHSIALFVGYALSLGCLGMRRRIMLQRQAGSDAASGQERRDVAGTFAHDDRLGA